MHNDGVVPAMMRDGAMVDWCDEMMRGEMEKPKNAAEKLRKSVSAMTKNIQNKKRSSHHHKREYSCSSTQAQSQKPKETTATAAYSHHHSIFIILTMSDPTNAPIDDKWLDRPRANNNNKRILSEESSKSSLPNHKSSKRQKDVQQASLLSFFSSSSSSSSLSKKKQSNEEKENGKSSGGQPEPIRKLQPPSTTTKQKHSAAKKTRDPSPTQDSGIGIILSGKPMIPIVVSPSPKVRWTSPMENVILRTVRGEDSRQKVAGIDLDGTLTVWRTNGWPSKLDDYELWNSKLIAKLRSLYDEDGYKLVIFTNQGAIRKAHNGKKATLVKHVIDWIAQLVNRPIHAVLSTKSPKNDPTNTFHKPTDKMWGIAIRLLNQGQAFDISQSFFVGDSADVNDAQGGVDFRFAKAVSKKYGSELTFYEPTEFFGPSDASCRGAMTK